MAMISLAHPDFRNELFNSAREAGLIDRNRTLSESLFGIYPARMEETREFNNQKVAFRPAKPVDDRLIEALPASFWKRSPKLPGKRVLPFPLTY